MATTHASAALFAGTLVDAKLPAHGSGGDVGLELFVDVLILLEGRLQIEETYKRHPEIADEEIHEPIIIIGQGRSGTSLLQNVLAAHPDIEIAGEACDGLEAVEKIEELRISTFAQELGTAYPVSDVRIYRTLAAIP